ncbi:hypothetical protein BKA62DRAFT_337444 [Auriculariales sp. MPI-PUGE-AT-0066]|nr:hypothetical protein BKA62DRAFT_337444 [Auriculariales sp. MPI-PUGE-AT-0066]
MHAGSQRCIAALVGAPDMSCDELSWPDKATVDVEEFASLVVRCAECACFLRFNGEPASGQRALCTGWRIAYAGGRGRYLPYYRRRDGHFVTLSSVTPVELQRYLFVQQSLVTEADDWIASFEVPLGLPQLASLDTKRPRTLDVVSISLPSVSPVSDTTSIEAASSPEDAPSPCYSDGPSTPGMSTDDSDSDDESLRSLSPAPFDHKESVVVGEFGEFERPQQYATFHALAAQMQRRAIMAHYVSKRLQRTFTPATFNAQLGIQARRVNSSCFPPLAQPQSGRSSRRRNSLW